MSADRIRGRRGRVLQSMLRLLTLIALAVALPLGTLACGQEDEEEAAGQTVEVVGTDFALAPATIHLDEAGTYTFRFVNEGESEHALEIDGQGIEEETDLVAPGETAELTVELTEGEYEMYCPVDGHRGMGMDGAVVVGTGGGAGTTEHEDTTTDEEEETTTEDDGYRY